MRRSEVKVKELRAQHCRGSSKQGGPVPSREYFLAFQARIQVLGQGGPAEF